MMKTQWKAASYGTGKRHWYLIRERDNSDGHCPIEVAENSKGQYRRFASFESADKAVRANLERKVS